VNAKVRGGARLLVVVPVFGEHERTHALLGDLRREANLGQVVIVDNRGDYLTAGDEEVLRPGDNLGWAGGTNYGTLACRRPQHDGVVWLNNDTRLSQGFLGALLRSWRATDAGVLGPVYDCHWVHQRARQLGPVEQYRPRRVYRSAPFIDGTCMFVPTSTLDDIGLLDADTFTPLGWGAEIDYCLRVRAAGRKVVITALAYLHHEQAATAKAIFGGYDGYHDVAYPVMMEGLGRKWGAGWPTATGIDTARSQTARLGPGTRLWRVRRRTVKVGSSL
jgi:GT2 family glycosyltransferase